MPLILFGKAYIIDLKQVSNLYLPSPAGRPFCEALPLNIKGTPTHIHIHICIYKKYIYTYVIVNNINTNMIYTTRHKRYKLIYTNRQLYIY